MKTKQKIYSAVFLLLLIISGCSFGPKHVTPEVETPETYRYSDGRLVRGEYVNVDGWLNGILTFKSGGEGALLSADFESSEGAAAKVEFSYDLDFNLVGIKWIFDSGLTQTYSYTYEASL